MHNHFWDKFTTWNEAEKAWDEKKDESAKVCPLKSVASLPNRLHIHLDTKKCMWLKGLFWIVKQDRGFVLLRYVVRHPLLHGYRYIRALFFPRFPIREEAFYYYGLKGRDNFNQALADPESLFILGFAYCHKPFECPSGRFSSNCTASIEHPVCCQCFIGKCVHTLPQEKTLVVIVPTVNHIGQRIFEEKEKHPKKRLIFLITACEMMLEMFAAWAEMIGVQGIGVRLEGRVCNTFEAFKLSERGMKPGLTVVGSHASLQMLDVLKRWRNFHHTS